MSRILATALLISTKQWHCQCLKVRLRCTLMTVVVGVGFEPTYAARADLQSAAFNHSATPPDRHYCRCNALAKMRRPCELKRHSSFVNKEVTLCPQKPAKNICRRKTGHEIDVPPQQRLTRLGHLTIGQRSTSK